MLRNVEIAVTGATGFIGAALLPALGPTGARLRLLMRVSNTTQFPAHITVRPGELADRDALAALVRGADCVLHLAGYAHAASKTSPVELERHRRINLEGTQNLFNAAASAGVRRFVFISSVKAGGEDARECLNERSARLPADPYGRIKRQTEDWLLEQGARRGVHVAGNGTCVPGFGSCGYVGRCAPC